MKLEEIKAIVELMSANDLAEFELEEEGVRIAIKKGVPQIVTAAPSPLRMAEADVSIPAIGKNEPDSVDDYDEVKAPFVGTFYNASTPDSEPYVRVGMEVEPDSVLCIIEAMKVMNEIKAEMRGIVRAVLAENVCPVQYGQPLFKIEKI